MVPRYYGVFSKIKVLPLRRGGCLPGSRVLVLMKLIDVFKIALVILILILLAKVAGLF